MICNLVLLLCRLLMSDLNKKRSIDPYMELHGHLLFLDEIENCYREISNSFMDIDENLKTNPDLLYKNIQGVKSNLTVLKILLDTLWWDKKEKKRFNKVSKYYKIIKKDVWNSIFELLNEEELSIKDNLNNLFYELWETLKIIDDDLNNTQDRVNLDFNFYAIQDVLTDWLKSKELSKSEYNMWANKLNLAKNYVRHIYSGAE